MASNEDIRIRITAEDKASGVLGSIGSKVGGLSGALGGLAKVGIAGAVAGMGSLIAVGISSIKAFDDQDKAIKQLEAVLKSTGNAAGLTKEELLDMASSFQKTTTFADETVTAMQNVLLTFTNVKGPVFKDANQAILDMSAALGTDLQSAAIQVGKALNDPIQGISALSRVGVSFTEQQKEQIATLVESGKTMEAQKIIIAELAREFGGSAAAATETFSGKMLQLQNNIGELQESIGSALVTAIMPFITQLSDWAAKPETQEKIQEIVAGIANLATQMTPVVQQLIPALIKGFEIAAQIGKVFAQVLFIDIPNAVAEVFVAVIEITGAIERFIMRVEDAIRKVRSLISETAAKVGNKLVPFADPFGKKASGGLVQAGRSFLVGESGPEIFTPNMSGGIIPNNKLSGGSNIVLNITGTFLSEDAAERMANLMMDKLKLELRI